MATCPICGRQAAPRVDNRSFPFCSPRCKSVDLGGWLDERYRVPVTDESLDESEPASSAEQPTQEKA